MKQIDWNIWHSVIRESLQALNINTILDLAKTYDLHWCAHDEDPVTASSLYEILTKTCEDLISKYVNDWKHSKSENLKNNTYYNFHNELTIEVRMYSHIDSAEILPRLQFVLKKDPTDYEWYIDIDCIISEQIF